MKKILSISAIALVAITAFALGAIIGNTPSDASSAPPKQQPSSLEDIRTALFGGVPGDRWKEGCCSRESDRCPG